MRGMPSRKSSRILIAKDIAVEVRIARPKPDRVFGQEPARFGIIVPRPVIVQAALRVELAGGVGEGVRNRLRAAFDAAVAVVGVVVDDETEGVGQLADRALVVGLVEVGLASALLGQGLVDRLPTAVARQQRVGAVIFTEDVAEVVNVLRDGAAHVRLYAPAEAVVAVGDDSAAGQVDAGELVLGVVGGAGDPRGAAGRCRIGTLVADPNLFEIFAGFVPVPNRIRTFISEKFNAWIL